MSKIFNNLIDAIGKTPLIELKNIEKKYNLKSRILAKVESFNPAGSAKDRAALYMILDAEKKGILKPDSVLIEPTSGNTGIGLAWIGALHGYKVILTMPDTMSQERRSLLAAYGAQLVLTPGALGMKGAIEKAEELAKTTPNAFIPGQFTNPANAQAHFETTGPEIWADTDGNVDCFVAGVGTGGTLTGTGRYLRTKNAVVKIIAVEPADSPVLTHGKSGPHKLQGIGANFVPAILDTKLYDRVVTVTTEAAYSAAKELVRSEGLLTGISAGAALWASIQVASEPENAGKSIVVLLPDTGERYLSAGVFA